MKIIDILVAKANETLEDGFKFKYYGQILKYHKYINEIYFETGDNKDKTLGMQYILDKCLNDEVEVIKEKKCIEELHIVDEGADNETLYKYIEEIYLKINELVRKINKIKEREE